MMVVSEDLKLQIEEAKQRLRIARQEESLADPEYLHLAIEKTNIAEAHLNSLFKQAKM